MQKKFKYSMQNILGLRDTMKRAREMELSDAHMRLRKERNALRIVLAEMRKAMEFDEKKAAKADAMYFFYREQYLRKLRMARDNAENAVRMATIHVEKCRVNLIEAHTELRKMERGRDREAVRWRKEVNIAEGKFNDEISSIITSMRPPAGLE